MPIQTGCGGIIYFLLTLADTQPATAGCRQLVSSLSAPDGYLDSSAHLREAFPDRFTYQSRYLIGKTARSLYRYGFPLRSLLPMAIGIPLRLCVKPFRIASTTGWLCLKGKSGRCSFHIIRCPFSPFRHWTHSGAGFDGHFFFTFPEVFQNFLFCHFG